MSTLRRRRGRRASWQFSSTEQVQQRDQNQRRCADEVDARSLQLHPVPELRPRRLPSSTPLHCRALTTPEHRRADADFAAAVEPRQRSALASVDRPPGSTSPVAAASYFPVSQFRSTLRCSRCDDGCHRGEAVIASASERRCCCCCSNHGHAHLVKCSICC